MASSSETLEYTPTWVVAAVCTVIIAISLCVERVIHYLGKFLKSKRQDALLQALEKLKEELMLLGFISLLLTVSQSFISHICIPQNIALHMLPCKMEASTLGVVLDRSEGFPNGQMRNRRNLLSESAGSDDCMRQGKVPLLTLEALHQLHIFIFVLAVVHVVFCATTMILGGAKIRQWKHWEDSIQKENIKQEKCNFLFIFFEIVVLFSTPESDSCLCTVVPWNLPEVPTGEQPHREFYEERAKGFWRKTAVVSWTISFFKQFYASVTRSDYIALRYGFIMRHSPGSPNFNFHKYMLRALEDDFKKVVGVSWYMWLFVVIFLLLNVNGWNMYFWLSFLPLVLLLSVGAKLEHIITRLALEVTDEHAFEAGVKPSDQHFWFHRPDIVLFLVHFILFQNSFEIAFFFWVWSTYGFNSCILDSVGYIIPRLVVSLIVQVLCSYSTLPLYAIVTQMGDLFKQAIFAEHMQSTLRSWAARSQKRSGRSLTSTLKTVVRKNKKPGGITCNEVQMERMALETSGSSHSGPHLVASEIENLQNQAV